MGTVVSTKRNEIIVAKEVLPMEEVGSGEVNGEIEEETGEESFPALEHGYNFDFFVIGGGSGGLAAAIQAAKYGKKVGLADFVTATPSGTSWGLGGTCVNVGCIPKKLMHQAALIGQVLEDSTHFGWSCSEEALSHDWNRMVEKIKAHIQSLNWGYRVSLQKAEVEYFNALARFEDEHTLHLVDKNEKEVAKITSEIFLIAVGGRPRYLDGVLGGNPGEFCITSDDIFSLAYHPGKVVIIGGSYIALETAGFLCGIGIDVTVMVRSQLLRGFDQQLAEKIGVILEKHGVQMLRNCSPTEITSVEQGNPGKLIVYGVNSETGETMEEPCNTVILAVGRAPSVGGLNLGEIGVEVDPTSGKIVVNDSEQTQVEHVYALGDCAEGRLELTPVAIQAGVLLAKRLFGGGNLRMDYDKIATTVFTPLEYSCVGLSEEEALEKFGGDENIEVYHVTSQPLEFTLPARDKESCYSKLICVKNEEERIVGFHYLGPNAGEICQGFALAIKLNVKKGDLDETVGIHPTCAEQFTTMHVTKRSGDSWVKTGC
ncbi:Thioredoxin reductase 1, cytoplasmic [Orchesella cincta]|uniref:thioredoxin-disulfide reductase (NADPH) n=1 Tax=Orchesella cincta TaxID=48709 RepID=A0A1D2NJ66_ORCCI|nr:Thioredoxin reductase 1, cytoplasmic [Orchesella cincta]